MAIVDTPIEFLPSPYGSGGGSNTITAAVLLDAAGEKTAAIMQWGSNDDCVKVHFFVTTVPAGGNVEVSIETVSATTGDPTGTLVNAGATVTVAISGANQWYSATMGTPAAINTSDLFAAVLTNVSGQYNILTHTTQHLASRFPYLDNFVTGAWVKSPAQPNLVLETASGAVAVLGTSPGVMVSDLYASNTTPDEKGARFSLNVARRVVGIWGTLRMAAGDKLILYDAADGVVSELTLDNDIQASGAVGLGMYTLTAPVTLSTNVVYRLTLQPQSTTANAAGVTHLSLPNSGALASVRGSTAWYYTTRTDLGAWTDDQTRFPLIGLVSNGVDAGGMLLNSGMVGGIRG